MRWKRHDKQLERHAEALAATARMELDLGVGDWQATIREMDGLLDRIAENSRERQSEAELLINQLRQHIRRLEARIAWREQEYDRLEEQVCAKIDRAYQDGFAAGQTARPVSS